MYRSRRNSVETRGGVAEGGGGGAGSPREVGDRSRRRSARRTSRRRARRRRRRWTRRARRRRRARHRRGAIRRRARRPRARTERGSPSAPSAPTPHARGDARDPCSRRFSEAALRPRASSSAAFADPRRTDSRCRPTRGLVECSVPPAPRVGRASRSLLAPHFVWYVSLCIFNKSPNIRTTSSLNSPPNFRISLWPSAPRIERREPVVRRCACSGPHLHVRTPWRRGPPLPARAVRGENGVDTLSRQSFTKVNPLAVSAVSAASPAPARRPSSTCR